MNPPSHLAQFFAVFPDRLGGFSVSEMILLMIAAACGIYSFLHLVLISRWEARRARVAHLRGAAEVSPVHSAAGPVRRNVLARWSERLGAGIARSLWVGGAERRRLSRLLMDAGLRSHNGLGVLMLGKLAGLAIGTAAAWALVDGVARLGQVLTLRLAIIIGGAIIGWRAGDYAISILGRRRRSQIEQGLPDALDLLVICAEAGLSLDQGLIFVGREIAGPFPALGAEIGIMSSELRILGDRREALENFARRTNVSQARSVVATLIQTMKYGTPLAESLRVLAAEMRTARLLRIEEKAAQLPVILSIPLVAFLLPCTFIILLGPSILRVVDALSHTNTTIPNL